MSQTLGDVLCERFKQLQQEGFRVIALSDLEVFEDKSDLRRMLGISEDDTQVALLIAVKGKGAPGARP